MLGTAAAAAAACAAIVAPALVPAGSPGAFVTAAWAVQPNPDGTVTVSIKEFRDPAALQRDLRADGIPAIVRTDGIPAIENAPPPPIHGGLRFCAISVADLPETIGHAAVHPVKARRSFIFIIHPAAIPAGSTLLIADIPVSGITGSRAVSMMLLKRSHVASCPAGVVSGKVVSAGQ